MQKGRKAKVRYIQKMPETAQFSPRGKPGRPDEVELKIDQFEAIKLADYQGYNQAEGAQLMGISRPSFGRILREGRKIIADALVNSKIIRIRVSNIQVGVRQRDIQSKRELTLQSLDSDAKEQLVRDNILNFTAKARSKRINLEDKTE